MTLDNKSIDVQEYQTIEFVVADAVATIRLNRPDRYNSFTDDMHAEMRSAIKQVKNNKQLRCLVIAGNGKGFCSGQDLNGRYELVKAGNPNLGKSLAKNYNPLIESLMGLPIPVVCAVNGITAGAGIGLALACDIVIAAESASFVFAFANVGLVPDSGCSWSLVQALGLARAKALSLLGDKLTAKQAVDFGLIWQCVEDDALSSSVDIIVKSLVEKPAQGLSLSKCALNQAATNTLQQQLSQEAQLQTVAGRTSDYAEAVCAFVEKRAAVFSGK